MTLHGSVESTKIRLSVLPTDEKDITNYKYEKEITVNSSQTELITLRIDDLDVTKGYKFVAVGLTGIDFKKESNLKIESKSLSIFIQTDKSIYKPEESIKFRVIVVDSELRPLTLTADNLLHIYLTDPEKNCIKQWLTIEPKKGVFVSEFQLSELPILGNWTLQAKIGTDTKSKTVEVAEYVPPKFQVTIDSPTDFSAKDGKIRAIIRSKYTYGKLVKGQATVSMTPNGDFNEGLQTVAIDGKGTVEFDIQKDLNVHFSEYRKSNQFVMTATVVEELTGLNQTASKSITIHQSRYKVDIINRDSDFKTEHPIEFEVNNLMQIFNLKLSFCFSVFTF